MIDAEIYKVNEVFLKIEAGSSVEKELYDKYSFTNKKMKYHPKVKAKLWDGYIHLYNYKTQEIYCGLLENIKSFLDESGYTYNLDFSEKNIFSEELFKKICNCIRDRKLYDFQEKSLEHAIKNNRSIIVSATSSGKTMIMFAILMYYLAYGCKKVLIVSPKTSLVNQTSSDFLDYYSGDTSELRNIMELVYSGSERNPNAELTFITWQSLQHKEREYYNQFDCIIADEVHGFKADVLKKIMENTVNIKYKHGFTGTLSNEDEEEVNELVLTGLFGKVYNAIDTREMVARGISSDAVIRAIRFNYLDKELCRNILKGDKEIRKISDKALRKKQIYLKEVEYILNNPVRNNFLVQLALTRKENTLLMYHFVERHGDILYDLIKDKAKDYGKTVYYICGQDAKYKKTKPEEIERIRREIENNDNIILISSYGMFSTGNSVNNLHHVILSYGFQQKIITKQTLGRGLRKNHNKEMLYVYEIGDDFSQGTEYKNYTYKHFLKRLEIYREDGFEISGVEYNLSGITLNRKN